MLADGGLFDVSDHPLEVTDLISEHPPDVTDLLSEHPLKVTDLLAESPNISDHSNLTDLLRVSYTDLLLSSNIHISIFTVGIFLYKMSMP